MNSKIKSHLTKLGAVRRAETEVLALRKLAIKNLESWVDDCGWLDTDSDAISKFDYLAQELKEAVLTLRTARKKFNKE